MRIHPNFTGGNIIVDGITEDQVFLRNDLRDTVGDWCYWAFCVEGAAGKTLTFHLGKKRIGYWGPAVSHDLEAWTWLDVEDGNSFTYSFSENENKVYFAHHMLYHPDRFYRLATNAGLAVEELCLSRGGRKVPSVRFGEGEISVILTARHHACESTGNYVLEGVLDELISGNSDILRVLCVPFVDFDGVVDGDQGKSRYPHDHNRDYTAAPIYPEVAAIQRYVDGHGCHYGFDFHSPWHKGGEFDNIYVVRNNLDKVDRFDRFSEIFEREITPRSMKYSGVNDLPFLTGWNQPSANFAYTVNNRPECELAFSLESAYFGTGENKVTEAGLIELGRCFARAVLKYIETK